MKEFNSQVCTSVEQSKRLLAMGLKPETADMIHFFDDRDDYQVYHRWVCRPWKWDEEDLVDSENIPAWSLHRLMELCGVERMPISFHKKGKSMIRVNHIHPTHNGRSNYNHYDSLIDCIEWLIEENNFNKEYLKQ